MKATKKIISTILLAVFLVSAIPISAFAYDDGGREVLYYSFTMGNGSLVSRSDSSMKRLYNREWVVTVSSRSNNSYGITYAMLNGLNTQWEWALESYTTTQAGTGNFGATYPDTSTVGAYLYLGALINYNDLNKGVTTSGQWSTDAPW